MSPGIGFGDYGDAHVRFSLIENEERTRQAQRGIKANVRKGARVVPHRFPEARPSRPLQRPTNILAAIFFRRGGLEYRKARHLRNIS